MTSQPRWRGQPLDAVLFDLDGTLLDTAGDIHVALNRAIGEFQWLNVSEADVRRMIGRGSPILVERVAAAQGRALDAATQASVVERFFHHYGALQENEEFAARPYPGAAAALELLHGAGVRTAVVTNKQERFASGLLERLHLRDWVDLVVGGDSCERRKPDPQPLLVACGKLGALPSRTLMVGDSINDVLAARAAQIAVICVPYGYNEGNDPRDLPCDALIEDLSRLASLLLPVGGTRTASASAGAT
jgi:phosphoglycolate phosphatase